MKKFFFFVSLMILFVSCAGEKNKPNSVVFKNVELNRTYGDCETENKPCAEITINYVSVANPDKIQALESIETDLQKLIIQSPFSDKNAASIDERINAFIELYQDFLKEFPNYPVKWEDSISAKVIMNERGIFSVQIDEYIYSGGAHSNSDETLVSYSIDDGKIISLDTFLKDGYTSELTSVAEQIFRQTKGIKNGEELERSGYTFENGKFSLNENYAFTPEGILFYYAPYEIAPYALGAASLLIPYNKIQSIIKENSILAQL